MEELTDKQLTFERKQLPMRPWLYSIVRFVVLVMMVVLLSLGFRFLLENMGWSFGERFVALFPLALGLVFSSLLLRYAFHGKTDGQLVLTPQTLKVFDGQGKLLEELHRGQIQKIRMKGIGRSPMPWDFSRYQEEGFRGLFTSGMGYPLQIFESRSEYHDLSGVFRMWPTKAQGEAEKQPLNKALADWGW